MESAASTFEHLTLLVAAGLLGPLLGLPRRFAMPVIIGELVAGAVIGRTGLRLIDPGSSAFPTLYQLGFAMLMFNAGTHVDVTSPALRSGFARGALALLLAFGSAVAVGWALSTVVGVGHAPLFIVLLAGSSAAIAFPIIEERQLSGPEVSFLITWIALADSATVVLMPLTLTGSAKLLSALGGDIIIIAFAGLALIGWPRLVRRSRGRFQRAERVSVSRGWALQVRISVLLLLVLSAFAAGTGGSTLLAGFAAGAILARVHESDRLSVQLTGLANGFFVPIFFVLLGATLDLRALFGDWHAIGLALGMAIGAVIVHVTASLVAPGRRAVAGLAASAQMGLPAAAASLALAAKELSPAYASAIVAAACLTLVPATIGALRLGDPGGHPPPSDGSGRGPRRRSVHHDRA